MIDRATFAFLLSGSLFFGMLLLLYLGNLVGRVELSKRSEVWGEVFGIIQGALFALLGLLIAFTFSGAYDRYDHRRHLIVEEANAIGTAYLRLDLLPEVSQPLLRAKFRTYVSSRIALYQKLNNPIEAIEEQAKANRLQKEIWDLSLNAVPNPDDHSVRMLLLPALNQMIDITATRKNAILTHAPSIIIMALICLSLACAFLAGMGMVKSHVLRWLHAFLFSGITAFVVFIILDLEYPHAGLITLDRANELLIEVRNGM